MDSRNSLTEFLCLTQRPAQNTSRQITVGWLVVGCLLPDSYTRSLQDKSHTHTFTLTPYQLDTRVTKTEAKRWIAALHTTVKSKHGYNTEYYSDLPGSSRVSAERTLT